MNIMSKKLLSILSLASLSTVSALASPQNAQNPYRFGIGFALEHLTVYENLKTDFSLLGAGSYGTTIHQGRSFQVAPSVEFGRFMSDDFYIGLVASWHSANTSNKHHANLKSGYTLQHDFKLKSYFDALFKIGYKVNQYALVYTKIGPSFAKWSHNTTQLFSGVLLGQPVTNKEIDTFNVSKNSVGLALGLGFEIPASQNIMMSFDYTHTVYKKQTFTKTMSILEMGVPRTREVSKTVTPSHGVFAVRISYFF